MLLWLSNHHNVFWSRCIMWVGPIHIREHAPLQVDEAMCEQTYHMYQKCILPLICSNTHNTQVQTWACQLYSTAGCEKENNKHICVALTLCAWSCVALTFYTWNNFGKPPTKWDEMVLEKNTPLKGNCFSPVHLWEASILQICGHA